MQSKDTELIKPGVRSLYSWESWSFSFWRCQGY